MPDIYLEEWAARKGAAFRTSQDWAKAKKIPARLKRVRVLVEKTVIKYVIDEDAPLPH